VYVQIASFCKHNANICQKHTLCERLPIVLGCCYTQTLCVPVCVCVCVCVCYFCFGRESFLSYLHATKETSSVKWKAHCSRGKLPLHLGKRQTQKPTKNQHVKQHAMHMSVVHQLKALSLSKGRTMSNAPNRGTIALFCVEGCTFITQVQR